MIKLIAVTFYDANGSHHYALFPTSNYKSALLHSEFLFSMQSDNFSHYYYRSVHVNELQLSNGVKGILELENRIKPSRGFGRTILELRRPRIEVKSGNIYNGNIDDLLEPTTALWMDEYNNEDQFPDSKYVKKMKKWFNNRQAKIVKNIQKSIKKLAKALSVDEDKAKNIFRYICDDSDLNTQYHILLAYQYNNPKLIEYFKNFDYESLPPRSGKGIW